MTPAFIGTYTDKGGEGMYRAEWDSVSGKLSGLALAAKLAHPSWVLVEPTGQFLYAASEVDEGVVYSYSIAAETLELTLIGRQLTGGAHPCHLAVSADGRVLVVANYVGGSVAVLAVGADGTLGAAQVVQYDGSGPDAVRQAAPHPHGVAFDTSGRLWVADLGLDRLTMYQVGAGGINVASARATQAKAGSGPRYMVFHPTLSRLYVVGELDSTIMAYDLGGDGILKPTETLSTRAAGAQGENRAGAISMHSSGKFLYVTNRGDESVASYRIDAQSGALELIDILPVLGTEPRSAVIDPSGQYLLVTNQKSDAVVTYRIDEGGGLEAESNLAVPSPTCIAFIIKNEE